MASEQTTLNIKRFDMRSIAFHNRTDECKGPVIVMIGRRDTGKSWLVRDLMYHHQDIPIGTVISGTEAGNGFYANHIPKLFLHDSYQSILIDNILRRQKTVMQQIKHETETYGKSSIDPRSFVIMDDCLFDDKWSRDKLMRCLFMNGRHWRLMLIITMQYPLGIPPVLRTNIDYVFIMREPSLQNRKRIFENYAGMFPTFESFCTIMDQTTQNNECLVVHNNSKSNKITDQIFWYKAAPHENFRLGSQEFWDISARMTDHDTNEYDPNKLRKGTNNINVRKV